MNKRFAPKQAQRSGMALVQLIAPAGLNAATSLTSSGTTTFDVATPYRKLAFEKAGVHARTLPGFSAAAAGVATVFRVSAGTATAITASLTLDALTSSAVNAFTLLSTYTEDDLIVAEGNYFQVQVSLGTASVTTQAADLAFVIEAGILE